MLNYHLAYRDILEKAEAVLSSVGREGSGADLAIRPLVPMNLAQ
jgi:hypothetical protein